MADPLHAWRERGRWLDVFGLRVFVVEAGPSPEQAAAARPPLVVLHGFPTSCHDFEPALPVLAAGRRVVLLDFPGFGLSAKPRDYSYSLFEQAEVVAQVWRALGIDRAHLLAHDYGTSVATELLARHERELMPFAPLSVTLCNGSVHIELAQLTVTQRIMRNPTAGPWLTRLASERFFHRRMQSIFGMPDAVPRERLHAMWAGIQHAEGHTRLTAISRYLEERTRFWGRWIGALRRLKRPAHVLWGRRDPIAVPAIAEQLHAEIEGSRLSWLESLGHYPMLEAPSAWAAAVNGFLADHDTA